MECRKTLCLRRHSGQDSLAQQVQTKVTQGISVLAGFLSAWNATKECIISDPVSAGEGLGPINIIVAGAFLIRQSRMLSASSSEASAKRTSHNRVDVRNGSILLKKAKMNGSKFLPARPSKPVFRNPMHHRELTKAAGWKSD
jgi:hypothetical protein